MYTCVCMYIYMCVCVCVCIDKICTHWVLNPKPNSPSHYWGKKK